MWDWWMEDWKLAKKLARAKHAKKDDEVIIRQSAQGKHTKRG